MARTPHISDLEAWADFLVTGTRHPSKGPVEDIAWRCGLMVTLHRRAAAAYPLPEDWPFCALAQPSAR